MNPQTFSTEAILLTKKNFGDGNISLCLLTSDMGVVRSSAFGGQRLSKRFKGGIEYFQVFDAEIQENSSRGKTFFNLSCIKNVKYRFDGITNMVERYIAASYIQELASMLLNPMEKSGNSRNSYYEAVVGCLERINNAEDKNSMLDEVYDLSVLLYKDTGFIPQVECTYSADTKLCRLEHFNSNILEKAPKSFALLSELYS